MVETQQGTGAYQVVNGTYYHVDTPQKVIDILEQARANGQRVRVFYGDTVTGKDWMEEWDTIGTIGRSMGPVKVPLLIPRKNSTGGGSLLDHCIVRITVDGKDLYKHPRYTLPVFEVVEVGGEYPYVVLAAGEIRSRFQTRKQADRWISFIKGQLNRK